MCPRLAPISLLKARYTEGQKPLPRPHLPPSPPSLPPALAEPPAWSSIASYVHLKRRGRSDRVSFFGRLFFGARASPPLQAKGRDFRETSCNSPLRTRSTPTHSTCAVPVRLAGRPARYRPTRRSAQRETRRQDAQLSAACGACLGHVSPAVHALTRHPSPQRRGTERLHPWPQGQGLP